MKFIRVGLNFILSDLGILMLLAGLMARELGGSPWACLKILSSMNRNSAYHQEEWYCYLVMD